MSSISNYSASPIANIPENFGASDINTVTQQLQQNIEFLSQIMITAKSGGALIGYNARIDEDSLVDDGVEITVGRPVYYDTAKQKFRLSKLQLVAVGDLYVAAPSSEVWGIVIKKCSDTHAHLLLDGIATVDMTASAGSANVDGKWYLDSTLGEIRNTPDPLLIQPIILGANNGDILFRPFFADNYPRFVARQIQISPAAAGTINQAGQTVSITANTAVPGWLPADNAEFEGNAPAGAFFGYHMRLDPDLDGVWPPLYPGESRLLLDSGGNRSQGYTIITGSDSDRCVINEHGIWWMTNCAGQLPWDFLPNGATGQTTCPKSLPRRMAIESQFAGQIPTALNTVSSLQSAIPWIKVFKAGTSTPATRGDLELVLSENDWVRESPLNYSHIAIKEIANGQFTKGPVVTSIKSGSSSVTISGGVDVKQNEEDPSEYAGQLTIAVNASADSDILPLSKLLFGATTEAYGDVPSIGLRPGIDASFVLEMHIPKSVPADSKIRFVLTFLAAESMSFPNDVKLEAKALPESIGAAAALPGYSVVNMPTYPAGSSFPAGTYRTVVSDQFTVDGADRVFVKLSRAGATDGVGGMLQVLGISARF